MLNCLSLSAYRSCVFGLLNLRSNLNAQVQNLDCFNLNAFQLVLSLNLSASIIQPGRATTATDFSRCCCISASLP